jgi:hypothetical protein
MTNRITLYLYASDTFAEVYSLDTKNAGAYRVQYSDPKAQEMIEFLVDGHYTAENIIAGKEVGYDIDLTSVCDYYDLTECEFNDVDPHDVVPWTVFMSFFAHEHPEFGKFLDSLNFNHEHLDANCADWVGSVY